MPLFNDIDVIVHVILIFAIGITLANVAIEWRTDKRKENKSFFAFVILLFIHTVIVTTAYILKYYGVEASKVLFIIGQMLPVVCYSLIGDFLCRIIEQKQKMALWHRFYLRFGWYIASVLIVALNVSMKSTVGYHIFVILLFCSMSLVVFYYRHVLGKGETVLVIVFFFALAAMSIQRFSEYTALDVTCTLFLTALHFQLWQRRGQKLIIAEKNVAVLEASLTKSRMETALSQIQPHFIYNTLSTVSALCEIDPMKAQAVTNDFAEYLRYDLNLSNMSLMTNFKTELEHTKNYLRIEKTRFGERLNAVFNIEIDDFEVPSLTLQPLVENAVRHGIMQKKKGGTVTVSSYAEDGYAFIKVKDDGAGFALSADTDFGYGIKCTRERIELMPDGMFEIKSEPGSGTEITIRVKREKKI